MPVGTRGSRLPGSSDDGRSADRRGRTRLLLGLGIAAVAVVAAAFVLTRSSGPSLAAWSRLGTEDAHSLAFVGEDPNRLLFGHHGGVLRSVDGGRSWQPLAGGSDAMSLSSPAAMLIVLAGHDVLAESRDGGMTWQDIPAELPNLDLHGFAQDPADQARMWAYLATGGLWESRDGGRAWELVSSENVVFPVAISTPTGVRLFGVTANGLAGSDDGGRTWRTLGDPGLYPMTSLAAAAGGSVLVAGGPDGLARSNDGGASWSRLPFAGQPFAIALANAGRTVALVTAETEFFRSDDGGRTWPAAP